MLPDPQADAVRLRTIAPRKQRLFVLLTIALACTVTSGGAEILVRTLGRYNSPDTISENSLQYLPSIFARHVLAPDQEARVDEAWGIRPGAAPTGRVYRINHQGYRGAPVSFPKPEDEVRIVVLGGSAVFDPNANEGEDWPHRMQQRLTAMGHRDAVVLNAGVPGHASFDSLGRLYAHIWIYEPDFVLLYNAWNDIKYFPDLTPEMPLIDLFKPYDPRADPFQNYQGVLDRLLSNSQLYVKLRTRYLLWSLRPGLEGRRPARAADRTYAPVALEQYRLNIDLIVDAARNIGAQPILLTQATLVAPANDETDRERIRYEYQGMSHETLVRALQECNDVIRSVARAKGVPMLDLAETLSGRRELFEDHVHTSPAGSVAIAEAVAAFLRTRLTKENR